MSTVGQRIKALREARGLSQRALARNVGVSNGAINMIESGERPNPGYATMKRIARALGVPITALDPDTADADDSNPTALLTIAAPDAAPVAGAA